MRRSFNTAGPCFPDQHYMLPPERRLGRVMELIEAGKYFTLTGGRQIGKTTSANWLVNHYQKGERCRCIWVDVQTARDVTDPAEAFAVMLENFDQAVAHDLKGVPAPDRKALLEVPRTAILNYLRQLTARVDRPLVVLIDEADGLIGAAVVSFLTQLRQGYIARMKDVFPHSMALIGMRQVRDYTLSQDDRRAVHWLGTTSPFNITAEAAVLSASFSAEEVAELLAQHTSDTDQLFLPEAARRIWELSCGHPWLVNAMADQITDRDVRDRSIAVTVDHVEAAKETIILERRTHIDSLIARLQEPRVQRIIEPMLVGTEATGDTLNDDFAYVLGLGLLANRGGQVEIANPIYREVVPRALAYARQIQIRQEVAWYVGPGGGLDMARLMAGWQEFWRKDGHVSVAGRTSYREAGPHLMLMAFLQRIVNGGGRIEREYGLGRGALDLMIFWQGERFAIEVKLRRDGETEADALDQLSRYLDGAGLSEGWLVMFDLRRRRLWKEKLTTRKRKRGHRVLWIVGC